MRQTSEPIVMAGPLFQPLRGLLFAVAFFPLRSVLFGRPRGWLIMWTVLVIVGILSTFGPSPGSIEGMIYTTFPIGLQLLGMTEVLAQSLLLSVVLCYWVNHPEKRWLTGVLTATFLIMMLLSAMGLAFAPTKESQQVNLEEPDQSRPSSSRVED